MDYLQSVTKVLTCNICFPSWLGWGCLFFPLPPLLHVILSFLSIQPHTIEDWFCLRENGASNYWMRTSWIKVLCQGISLSIQSAFYQLVWELCLRNQAWLPWELLDAIYTGKCHSFWKRSCVLNQTNKNPSHLHQEINFYSWNCIYCLNRSIALTSNKIFTIAFSCNYW